MVLSNNPFVAMPIHQQRLLAKYNFYDCSGNRQADFDWLLNSVVPRAELWRTHAHTHPSPSLLLFVSPFSPTIPAPSTHTFRLRPPQHRPERLFVIKMKQGGTFDTKY